MSDFATLETRVSQLEQIAKLLDVRLGAVEWDKEGCQQQIVAILSHILEKMDTSQAIDLTALRRMMTRHFSMKETNSIIFDMGISNNEFSAKGVTALHEELLGYLDRRGEIDTLLEILTRERPHVRWPQFQK